MNIRNVLAVTILSSVLFSPLTFAGEDEMTAEEAEEAMMLEVLGETYEHQLQMKDLRQQVELLQQKKKIAELMFDCKKKGVTCNPSEDNDFGMVIIDDSGMDTGGQSYLDGAAIDVPEIEGLGGNLSGTRIEVGDEGYDPRFDPELKQGAGSDPAYSPYEQDIAGEEVYSEEQYNHEDQPYGGADQLLDPEMMGEAFTNFNEEIIEVQSMPPLLGIENDEAIFIIDSQEYRAKGGDMLPGEQWKVRDVSFDSVWMKGPDGKSKYVYINWR